MLRFARAASLSAFGACAAPNPAYSPGDGTGGQPSASEADDDAQDSGAPSAGSTDSTDPADSSADTGPDASDESDVSDGSAGSDGPDGSIEFTDDEWTNEFEAGNLLQLAWVGEALEVSPTQTSGRFISRVFDAGTELPWESLQWQPAAPYGKPLPNDGKSEAEYPRDAVDMTGNTLLLHLENFDPLVDRFNVLDASGRENHGFTDGVAVFDVVDDAAFGQGVRTHGTEYISGTDSYLSFPAAALEPGTEDFTWALWFRDTTCTVSGSILMAFDSPTDAEDTPSIWLSCELCPGGVGVGFAVHEPDGGQASGCAPAPIEAGRWHHVAMVKWGHADAEIAAYFDGQLLGSQSRNFTQPLEATADVTFTVGGMQDDNFAGETDLDEIAVWARALSAAEIEAVYRRGTTTMNLHVRACEQPQCSDDPPFVGASGQRFPPFSDGPNNLVPGEPLLLHNVVGRYVQYQVEFGRRLADGVSPALRAVSLRSE